jgi:hypothetical protein
VRQVIDYFMTNYLDGSILKYETLAKQQKNVDFYEKYNQEATQRKSIRDELKKLRTIFSASKEGFYQERGVQMRL